MDLAWWWCAAVTLTLCSAPLGSPHSPRYSSRIVHTSAGAIRGIIVEPASRRLEPVEVFVGVAYGGRPLRLQAPPAPPRYAGTKLADERAPACPQPLPDVRNRSEALERMPLGVLEHIERTLPFLRNQSEDCLYLDVYVPGSGARGEEAPYPVVVWAGDGVAAAVDAAPLAARGRLVIVTLNFRVGLLGSLTSTATTPPPGALDVLRALQWVRTHARALGGDHSRLTLLTTGEASSMAVHLLADPANTGLVQRWLLVGGASLWSSPLSPKTEATRMQVASALGCDHSTSAHGDWLGECIRAQPLQALVGLKAPLGRLPPGAPLSPGTLQRLFASDAFVGSSLAVVLCSAESYPFFNEDEMRHGFEEEHRNRILRTYVRNAYRFHRNEIFAAVRNEYTDWEKPIQHPVNIRDATLEALSDAAAAHALRVARAHARRGAATHLAHIAHAPRDRYAPARVGSVLLESIPFLLGAPLVSGGVRNYSRADAAAAEAAVAMVAAFAKSGEPSLRTEERQALQWPRYDLNTQQYLSIGGKVRIKSHYRGHKMALWLHLIPQLHSPGASSKHHQFRPNQDAFLGDVFPEISTESPEDEDMPEEESSAGGGAGRTFEECSSDDTSAPPPPLADATTTSDDLLAVTGADANAYYYNYTVALVAAVGCGCALLVLNVAVLTAMQMKRRRHTSASLLKRRTKRAATLQRGNEEARGDCLGVEGDLDAQSPLKSSLKRSRGTGVINGAPPTPVVPPPPPPLTTTTLLIPPAPKKRVQIQEISL